MFVFYSTSYSLEIYFKKKHDVFYVSERERNRFEVNFYKNYFNTYSWHKIFVKI